MYKSREKPNVLTWYVLCVIVLPVAFFSFQFERNIQYLALWQVVLLCAIIATTLILFFVVLQRLFHTSLGAFIGTTILFLSFFMYRSLDKTLSYIESELPVQFVLLIRVSKGLIVVALCYLIIAFLFSRGTIKRFSLPTQVFGHYALAITTASLSMIMLVGMGFIYRLIINGLSIVANTVIIFNFALSLMVICVLICKKYKAHLNSMNIPIIILVLLATILVQNVYGIARYYLTQKGEGSVAELRKPELNIDQTIDDQPNIYWFHCDGMLGLDASEAFFMDKQESFVAELETRRFWINPTAAFNAEHNTQYAIPILMNPTLFDEALAWRFDPAYAQSLDAHQASADEALMMDIMSHRTYRRARENNELVLAFNTSDYWTSIICRLDYYYYPTVDRFYNTLNPITPLMIPQGDMGKTTSFVTQVGYAQNLADLLNKITPLPSANDSRIRELHRLLLNHRFEDREIANDIDLFINLPADLSDSNFEKWNVTANALADVLTTEQPRFAIIMVDLAHRPFYYDEFGNYEEEDADNPWRYPAHQAFSVQILLAYIDIVLEEDPDAVIILQSDHGLHGLTYQEIMDAFDCTEEEVQALWNQTFSAIKLPQEKMTDENEQILSDPRNIARFLVNTYVGLNYQYIPPEFRQSFEGPAR